MPPASANNIARIRRALCQRSLRLQLAFDGPLLLSVTALGQPSRYRPDPELRVLQHVRATKPCWHASRDRPFPARAHDRRSTREERQLDLVRVLWAAGMRLER